MVQCWLVVLVGSVGGSVGIYSSDIAYNVENPCN